LGSADLSVDRAAPVDGIDSGRLKELFSAESGFVARVLRSFGVPKRDVDDAAQQVFIVLARKLAAVAPGLERGFLYRTAVNIAAHVRRDVARRREELGSIPDLPLVQTSLEDLVDERRARELLARRLEAMDRGAREVFLLHDVGRKTQSQIAAQLALPPGTVASRLRRARAALRIEVERLKRFGYGQTFER
jgi:RNA polymerase sigma-70 factor (ECF subfamily)